MLKYHVANYEALPNHKVSTMLQQALDDIGFSVSNTTVSLVEVLSSSLRRSSQAEAGASLFEFLDECLVRLAKRSVKYYDDLMEIVREIESNDGEVKSSSIGLFLTVIIEQWPFLVKSASGHNLRNVIGWLNRFVGFCMHADENTTFLSYFRRQIRKLVSDVEARSMLRMPLEELEQSPMTRISTISDGTDDRKMEDRKAHTPPLEKIHTRIFREPSPPLEVHDERDLTKWTKKDVGQATLDGDVGALVLCLCSKYEEVRNNALNSLKIIFGKLEVRSSLFRYEQGLQFQKSHYSEWQQTHLLLGEVIDTAMSQSPLPYFAGTIAARFLMVLSDPLHILYTKVNKFLNRMPRWDLTRLPSYWVDKILLQSPDDNDVFYQEVEWLLDALADGLRTPDVSNSCTRR